jgi:hypothetical protein
MADNEAAARCGPAPRSRPPGMAETMEHCCCWDGNDGALLPLPLQAKALRGARLMGQAGRQRRVRGTGRGAGWARAGWDGRRGSRKA